MNNLRKQDGISLLEVLLSLGIIAIILVMATRYYGIATRSQKVNQAVAQLGAIEGAVGNWKGAKTSYSTMTIQNLGDQGLLSSAEYNATDHTLFNPWGNQITSSATATTVTFTGDVTTTTACTAIADKLVDATCADTTITYCVGACAAAA